MRQRSDPTISHFGDRVSTVLCEIEKFSKAVAHKSPLFDVEIPRYR